MKGYRLVWQFYGVFATLIVATILIFSYLTIDSIQARNASENLQSLEIKAKLIRNITLPYLLAGRQLPEAEINKLSSIIGNRITVITLDGKVLSDSEKDPQSMDNHANRPEIREAGLNGIAVSERFSQTLEKDMQYLALRIDNQSGSKGFVRVSIPLVSLNERIMEFSDGIVMSASVVGIIALVLGYLMASRLSEPLVHMTRVAKIMADGDYMQRLPQGGINEIGELSRALNQLAASSSERISTIAAERNQLAAILAGLVEGVIAISSDQTVTHLNGAASRMLGLDPNHSIGKLLWELIRVSELINAIDTALKNEELVQSQFNYDQTSIKFTVVPLGRVEGDMSGAIIVLQDVSEVQRLETMKTDFVANASHELKTPITAIRGMVETIMEDPDMDVEDRAQFTSGISRQATRLGTIVGDLLTLSRFDASTANMEHKLVDLKSLVLNEKESLQAQGMENGVSVDLDIEPVPLLITGDEKALVQMINNLTDNAFKYTGSGGQVSISLGAVDQWIEFRVRDDGIGISEPEQNRVFERFYRVDKARSSDLGGTGLGLSIVKHIALAHGGDVSLESELNKGSVFCVRLPRAATS